MRSLIIRSLFLITGFCAVITITGCLKGEFDAPPTGFPEITSDKILTFDKLFEKLKTTSVTPILEEKYLEALVVADDKSGNFYKNLIIKDINGELGLSVSIDDYNLNANYPVGQKIYIFLKDLTIGYYEGLPTLGIKEGTTVGRIPAGIYKSMIFKGQSGLPVTPLKVSISDLNSKHFNRLIELEGMQFKTATASTTFADPNPADPQSVNHTLVNCANKEIVLRNSGFADFAGLVVPSGNGNIVCVYSYYRNAAQLFIRDTTDIKFKAARCGGGGPTGSQVSIQNLRAQYTGTAQNLTSNFVKGIVISDSSNKNINGQNMVVQDGEYGILLRFKSAINVPLGSEVKVGLTGGELSEYNKLLQVQNLENSSVELVSSNNIITPKVLTVSQIDIAKHESTLIKVENATLTGGSKFADKLKVKDASGEIDLFTLTAATFSGTAIPTGTVTVVAIVSEFTSGKQLTIRNAGDVTGGGPCDTSVTTADCDGDGVANGQDCSPSNAAIYPGGSCDDGNEATVNDQYDTQCVCKGSAPGAGINENFSSQMNNVDITLQGWANVAVKGNRKWQGKLFSGNTYAQATAFGTTAPAEMETWLISPVVNTATASMLSFESAKAFWVHDGLSVWVTSNYTGDPATTSWTKLTAKVAVTTDPDNTFIPSGNIDLKSYGANVRVGFKYEGTQALNTSTYRIDNVKVN